MHKTMNLLACFLGACAAAATSEPPAAAPTTVAPAPAPAHAQAPSTAAEATPLIGLPNERATLPGVLTGGIPSAEQLARAHAAGYKTVISLLSPEEASDEATEVRAAGLRFWSIPIAGASDLTEANALQLSAAMNELGAQPLIVHCASGNRVGALLALKAYYVDHASKEGAIELGQRAGLTSLLPAVQEQLH